MRLRNSANSALTERISFAGTGPAWLTLANMAVVRNNGRDVADSTAGGVFVPGSPEAFGHDPDGNLTSDGQWTYAWDAENRLIRMVAKTTVGPQQSIRFEYDGQGRRIGKRVWNSVGETGDAAVSLAYLYDGWNLAAEVDVRNAKQRVLVRGYMWGLDLSGTLQGAGGVGGLVGVLSVTGGQISRCDFAGHDGNGNVAVLVNAADGETSARYEYGPFGEVIRITGTMAKANPFRFSTKYQDDESDLLYYGYRFYSPSIGRWISRDPIEETGGVNLYGLVSNSPVGKVDRLGLITDEQIASRCECNERIKREDEENIAAGPKFDPSRWKVGTDNCLAYALNIPGGAKFPNGSENGRGMVVDDCKGLIRQIRDACGGRELKNSPCGKICDKGYHKIKVYSGFHVQRQDSDGSWSEMSKEPDYLPRKAALNLLGNPIESPTQGTPCGYLCVPN